MADDLIDERIKRDAEPDPVRVRSRAKSMKKEARDIDDPERAARQLLEESESRTNTDPAPRDLKEERVERRHSEDTTPPPEQE